MESLSASGIAHSGRSYSTSVSSFRHGVAARLSSCPRLRSCRGAYRRALSSSVRKDRCSSVKAIASRNKENLLEEAEEEEEECVYHRINRTNGATSNLFPSKMRVLDFSNDEYDGVVVDPDRLPINPAAFSSTLQFSLSHWRRMGKKGIWLKLPVENAELVPVAIKEGFEYHHAERGYVMLTYWIPETPCLLPSNATHQVGVGGFVINNKNEVLVVQEKYCSPTFAGLWKLPTGFIQESEEIHEGAVREVKEETGIDTEFIEVIAFRHAHNVAFQKSDLFFICMLKPLSAQIKVDDLEIQAAKWMPLTEFVEKPLIQEDGMFKKVMDICISRLGKRYCGLYPHQVVSKFDNQTSSLYYNVVDIQDTNCIGN